MKEIIIDASGSAMGRIATFVAKQALLGKNVFILNCNESVITGKKHAILEAYKKKFSRGGYAQKGPYFSKVPEKIFKRTIRGMLPWRITRGRDAFKRIKCFNESPEEYLKSENIVRFKKAKSPYITIAGLSDII